MTIENGVSVTFFINEMSWNCSNAFLLTEHRWRLQGTTEVQYYLSLLAVQQEIVLIRL